MFYKKIMTAAVTFTVMLATQSIQAQSVDTFDELQAFKKNELQKMLIAKKNQPTEDVDTKLYALGYRDGISAPSELSVLIAERELHKLFYQQKGDNGTVAKIQKEIDELKATTPQK